MKESMPSMVQPPQAAQKLRTWLGGSLVIHTNQYRWAMPPVFSAIVWSLPMSLALPTWTQLPGQAVAEARKQGVTDPGQLFEAGARAFLQGSWQRRDLALLFASGDAPPGFEVLRRQRAREWIGQNDSLLHLTDVPEDRVYAAILTSLIGEGSYEVAGAGNRRQAELIIDAVIEYARRLMAGGLPPRD